MFSNSGLESLPVELQRNFTLMRDLDGRAQGVMEEITRQGDEFLKLARAGNSEKKKELSSKIHVSSGDVFGYSCSRLISDTN